MQKEDTNVNVGSVMGRLARLVRLASKWAWREELGRYQNVTEDAQSLVDALMRGEPANAYCGYGRDGQASNYRDELKCSLRERQRSRYAMSHRMPFKPHSQNFITATNFLLSSSLK